jgi:hypothetical protein
MSLFSRADTAGARAGGAILRRVHRLHLEVQGRAEELVRREYRRFVSQSHSHDHSAPAEHPVPMRPIAEMRWREMGWIFCDGRRVAVERRGDATRVRIMASPW